MKPRFRDAALALLSMFSLIFGLTGGFVMLIATLTTTLHRSWRIKDDVDEHVVSV